MYRVEPAIPTSPRAPEPVEFSTAMGLLHWALRNRVFARSMVGNGPPKSLDQLHIRERRDAGMDYHSLDSFCNYKITAEHMNAMARALARWNRTVHYLREIEPQWVEGKETHYMDNSIEREDTNKYGQTRRVMVKPPSGDLCF